MEHGADLSKMAPTPALWALLRCTCSPVASRIPSLTAMERCEKEAMSSSFQPGKRGSGRASDTAAEPCGTLTPPSGAPQLSLLLLAAQHPKPTCQAISG